MPKYLGQFYVDVKDTPYANFTPSDWVLEYLFRYSQTDGSHHKQWVLDQTARILKGTKVIVQVAKWDNGDEEYRFWLDKPSSDYLDWVKLYKGDYIHTKENGNDDEEYEGFEFEYDEGIAP